VKKSDPQKLVPAPHCSEQGEVTKKGVSITKYLRIMLGKKKGGGEYGFWDK
jgi:hypothetical protein